MARTPSVERDTPKWPEPFAAMYSRIQWQSYVVVSLVVVNLLLGILLYKLGSRDAVHVYEIHPDGSAAYLAERESKIPPRASEARFVARSFVELLYGWNSSTALEDVTQAANMCAAPMAKELLTQMAGAQHIDALRKRNLRTEIVWSDVSVISEGLKQFQVHVSGRADMYPLGKYEGEPIDVRDFDLLVVLAAVPRNPERRLNGLEVVRLTQDLRTQATGLEKKP